MKYIWPLIIGAVFIAAIIGAWSYLAPYGVLCLLAVLIFMPIAAVIVQGKGGMLFAFVGLVIGAFSGIAIPYYFGSDITEAITGPVASEYNIRTDLVLWWVLGASIFATGGSLAGGWLGRRLHVIECN